MTANETALGCIARIARRTQRAGETRRKAPAARTARANVLDDLTPRDLDGVVGGNQPFTPHSIRGYGGFGVR